MNLLHSAALVAVMAAVTILLRFLPFLIFRPGRPIPAVVAYLGEVLPAAIIGMLVVYCLRDTAIAAAPHGTPLAVVEVPRTVPLRADVQLLAAVREADVERSALPRCEYLVRLPESRPDFAFLGAERKRLFAQVELEAVEPERIVLRHALGAETYVAVAGA